MGRGFVVVAVCALLIAIGYGLGVSAESVSLNQCYAVTLRTFADKADRAALSKSDAAIERFEALVRSLPLAGSKTDCKRLELALAVPDTAPAPPRTAAEH